MTCRHSAGDPNCSSHPDNVRRAAYEDALRERAELASKTPDAERYEIVDVLRVGPHLVAKVLYPNCSKCSYEGNKIMVFLNVTEVDVLKWRKIDPHFRDPKASRSPKEAPGPAARFPASPDGWKDAVEYANRKATVTR